MKEVIRTKEIHEWIYPEKIVVSEKTENTERLLTVRTQQVPLYTQDFVTIQPNGYFVLDFGKEYTGGVRIMVYRAESPTFSVKGRIRFGESVGECMAELGEKNANNHHSVRDMEVDIVNLSDFRAGSSAFRFVRFDNLGEYPIKLLAIYLDYVHSDAKTIGTFECNDGIVNDIFQASQRTVFLNMQNGVIWDGVKRDRLVWAGDLNVEMLTAFYSYGNVENIRNSLALCAKSAPLPMWMNNIPTYSMWFIINLYDYFMFTADDSFVKEQIEYVNGVLEQLGTCIDEAGEIDFLPETTGIPTLNPYFIDWPSRGHEGVENGVSALFKIAIEKVQKLYGYVGLSNPKTEELLQKLQKKEYGQSKDKQIVALTVLAKKALEKGKAEFLKNGGSKGMSTFMAYYILAALAELGETQTAFEIMKEYFGGMLSVGATTFFEDFDMDWLRNCTRIDELPQAGKKDIHGDYGKFCYVGYRHSLCHGWASGAVPFLIQKVLGVEIVEPAFKKIRITPSLCGLQYVNATLPTPFGEIKISLEEKNGETVSSISLPEHVSLVK
ncbi:MAG: alpha-L-rhamnosidase [Clostridia bacterium]|nr:alpha-L-rhamnosidase [Clostridia bacterium]